jgi:hypothetical protein
LQEDGTKLKGEITLVIAPGQDVKSTQSSEAKGMGFDLNKDS